MEPRGAVHADTYEKADDTAISTTDVSMDSIRKIGDITVEVKSGSRGRRHKARSSDTRAAHHSTSRVSEKLLKGSVKSLRTRYGQLIVIYTIGR